MCSSSMCHLGIKTNTKKNQIKILKKMEINNGSDKNNKKK